MVSVKGLRFNTPSDLSGPVAKAHLDIVVPLLPAKLTQLVDIPRYLVRLGAKFTENVGSFTHPYATPPNQAKYSPHRLSTSSLVSESHSTSPGYQGFMRESITIGAS